MFFLRKFVAATLFPASIIFGLLSMGLFFRFFTRRRMLGRIFLGCAALLFILTTQNTVGDALLLPLESKYPAVLDLEKTISKLGEGARPRWIVVLGGGYNPDPALPLSSRLSSASLHRLTEGIRLQRRMRNVKLILSGGALYGGRSEAMGMHDMAMALGVEKGSLRTDDISWDTRAQAMNIKKLVGAERFFLVTSASHMPRAMALFRKEKMRPIPAPTDHRIAKSRLPILLRYFPSAGAMEK
ncbi:MAG: DUF218 domain-containing protein, partial [Nitrospinaceae bacterium]|nr:DUF218 domain-containing protein [Nitrospinaceae bacterium]